MRRRCSPSVERSQSPASKIGFLLQQLEKHSRRDRFADVLDELLVCFLHAGDAVLEQDGKVVEVIGCALGREHAVFGTEAGDDGCVDAVLL